MLYFGCYGRCGHYLWNQSLYRIRMEECPVGTFIDGGLAPRNTTEEGIAEICVIHGWTFLAFWDRSQDSRPGCNSAFMWKGTHSFDDMILKAKADYPKLFERFKFEIKLNERD